MHSSLYLQLRLPLRLRLTSPLPGFAFVFVCVCVSAIEFDCVFCVVVFNCGVCLCVCSCRCVSRCICNYVLPLTLYLYLALYLSLLFPFLSRMSPHQGTCRSEVAVEPVFQIWTSSKNFMVFLIETYQNQLFPASGAFFQIWMLPMELTASQMGPFFFRFLTVFFPFPRSVCFSVFSPFYFHFIQ